MKLQQNSINSQNIYRSISTLFFQNFIVINIWESSVESNNEIMTKQKVQKYAENIAIDIIRYYSRDKTSIGYFRILNISKDE